MLTAVVRRVLLVIPNIILLTAAPVLVGLLLARHPGHDDAGARRGSGDDRRAQCRYGFDRPVHEQYLSWMWNALHGDLGRSYVTRQSVADAILPRILVTLEIAGLAVALAVVATAVMNSIPVARRAVGAANTGMSLVGITVPNFMLGISLIYLFSVQLGWLPTTGWVDWSEGLARHCMHILMPVLTLSAFFFGSFSLVYRAGIPIGTATALHPGGPGQGVCRSGGSRSSTRFRTRSCR